ncbi:hypothetical protein AAF712_012165 [Marasmius tenuissimus]|uniref:Uncharacterized protein n=1 Tax=Marasmius tenuissimus TaxID=585030 RepID=A0ABR2ZJA1_9AGAR
MSKMIAIFGGLSLPPQSPRIKNAHVTAMSHQASTQWDFVECLVADKEKLGYQLSDGDRYWVMWINLADIQKKHGDKLASSELNSAVEVATSQVEHIWPRTRKPDLLAPYFDVLLDHGTPRHLSKALAILCDILTDQRNVHPAMIKVVWRFLLLDPATLSPQSQDRFLSVLWRRAQVHPHSVPGSRSMATHIFNPSTKRHERHVLGVRHLVAMLTAPLFPIYFTSVPSSVSRWAIGTLRASLSPKLTHEARWRKMSLLALSHSFEHRPSATVSSECEFSDWDAILTLHMFEIVVTNLADNRTEGARIMLGSLWRRWLEIPDNVERPSFVNRAFIAGCFRLAGRIGALDICNDAYRYCAQQELLLADSRDTKAERDQVEALVNDYAEAFVRAGGGRFTHVLRAISSPSRTTFAANAVITLPAFITRDITIAYDLYAYCVRNGISIAPEVEYRLALELAPTLPSATIPFLSKYRNEVDKLHDLLPLFLRSLLMHHRQYVTPTQGRAIAEAMTVLLDSTVPALSLRLPISHALKLVAPHCPELVVHWVHVILKQSPSYFRPRFLRSLTRVLIHHRFYRSALRLQRATCGGTARGREEIREMLFFVLVRRGANNLATRCHPSFMGKLRELSAKGSQRFFLRRPALTSTARMRSRRPDPRLISCLFLSYLQRGRQDTARKMLVNTARYMDARMRTSLGNAFLDSLVSDGKSLNVLNRTREYLSRRVGFIEDRITLNIFIKALLRRGDMDSYRIRILFDQLVRAGYPVKDQWRRNHGVPFGSPPSSSFPFDLTLSKMPPITFRKHVQPLYKMFIKGFHLRKDIVGAKTVIGILKGEEVVFLTQRTRVD